jgi:hypothetical protein
LLLHLQLEIHPLLLSLSLIEYTLIQTHLLIVCALSSLILDCVCLEVSHYVVRLLLLLQLSFQLVSVI